MSLVENFAVPARVFQAMLESGQEKHYMVFPFEIPAETSTYSRIDFGTICDPYLCNERAIFRASQENRVVLRPMISDDENICDMHRLHRLRETRAKAMSALLIRDV